MKTIQVILDERTLVEADRLARRAGLNRSALIRNAIKKYAAQERLRAMEDRHRRGYEDKPVAAGEFDVWDGVLSWQEE